jgi:hypothetical protein
MLEAIKHQQTTITLNTMDVGNAHPTTITTIAGEVSVFDRH